MSGRATMVLGGGRSSRMGADKLTFEIDGKSLLVRTVAAALAWADSVVVAGGQPDGWAQQRDHLPADAPVVFRREHPPFGGPVAGIATAFTALDQPDEVMILAGDLANPGAVVRTLADAAVHGDGVVLEDGGGWPQYLAGRYRADAVAAAVGAVGDARDMSVRRLLGHLDVARVSVPESVTRDLDTPGLAYLWGAKPPQSR